MNNWFYIFIIIIVFIIIYALKNNSSEEKLFPKEDNKLIEPNPKSTDFIVFLDFFKNASNETIDKLYKENYYNKLEDSIIKRAFIKRWRFETFDYDFWLNLINEREYNKKNNIKRKIRTQEELYQEMVLMAKPVGYKSTVVFEDFYLIDILEIKGVHIDNRFSEIKKINRDSELILQKESNNSHDKNAVQILHDYSLLGYVDKSSTSLIRRVINNGYKCLLYDFEIESGFKKAFYAIYLKKISSK